MNFEPIPGWQLSLSSAKLRHFHQRHASELNGGRAYDQPADEAGALVLDMVPLILDAYGYPVSEEGYRAIEAGRAMPILPYLFFNAFADAMDLSDTETSQLVGCFLVDVAITLLTAPAALETLAFLLADDTIALA